MFSLISLRTRTLSQHAKWVDTEVSFSHSGRVLGEIRAVCRAWHALIFVLAGGDGQDEKLGVCIRGSCSCVKKLVTFLQTSQMTDNRQHVESTTLRPCRPAAPAGNTMWAWRVLIILRRVALVGVCHLSPDHTAPFCCAAAACACSSIASLWAKIQGPLE